ncbi:MAG TPA: SDR family NAD(P)-dependent oxidoreductase [Caulobacteraceae bacterium]|jgi:NAD(P)-dependent dehydrogenase (short-subunit alcohol dehydrogenase family)|nr:SDR family NAD(P)-dependent oxidoreductase [Caulobacteraceae bacterium]
MTDRNVLVTGAFGGLGGAVVEAFVANGDRVAAVDLAAEAPAALAAAVGGRAVMLGGHDLGDPAGAAAAVEAAAAALDGRLDGLVNLAGGFAWQTVADGDAETWDRLYTMNLKTCVNMCRAAIPHLRRAGGRIVNVGAGGAVKAAAGMGAYAASKSGVHRLTEALAEELKGEVAVNAVLPSTIDTPANRRDLPNADFSAWVTPADLAQVILFLASDKARAVTGALLAVNGRV